MSIYVTSDEHYHHKNIAKYENRPDGWMQLIVANNNAIVQPTDTVYHLGDFAYASLDMQAQLLQALNGKHIIVLGNHDRKVTPLLGVGFSEVLGKRVKGSFPYLEQCAPYARVTGNDGRDVLLSHMPLYQELLPDKDRGLLNYHGHVHSKPYVSRPHHVNASVDVTGFSPILLQGKEARIARHKAGDSSQERPEDACG